MEPFPPSPPLCLVACFVLVVVAVAVVLGAVLSSGPPITAPAASCPASRDSAVPLLAAPFLASPAVACLASRNCADYASAVPLLVTPAVTAAVLATAHPGFEDRVCFSFLSPISNPRREPSPTMLLLPLLLLLLMLLLSSMLSGVEVGYFLHGHVPRNHARPTVWSASLHRHQYPLVTP